MRAAACLVVMIVLAGAALEGQEHAPVTVKPAPVKVVEVAKPVVAGAKPAAAPSKPPAPAPKKTLEQAAEAIAAKLASRTPAPDRLSRPPAPARPRVTRVPRITLRWPADDIQWDVQWPTPSDRVVLSW